MVIKQICKSFTLLIISLISCCLVSCDEVFQYHPYDVRITGKRDINNKNIAKIQQQCKDKDTLYVVFTGDTQSWFDQTLDLIKDINSLKKIDFVIHQGDFTDYGVTKEFMWQRDVFEKLNVPYVGLIGNHDILGTGKQTYQKIWGKTNFSFIAGGIKFICLNTNALEYDYSEAVPDFDFLEQEAKTDTDLFESTIVSMHVPPLNEQFNNNALKPFHLYLHCFKHLMFCTAGHVHNSTVSEPLGDGIIYYTTQCAKNRQYHLFTITKNSYTYEIRNY